MTSAERIQAQIEKFKAISNPTESQSRALGCLLALSSTDAPGEWRTCAENCLREEGYSHLLGQDRHG